MHIVTLWAPPDADQTGSSDAYKSEQWDGFGNFCCVEQEDSGTESSGSSSGVMNKDWFIRCDNLYVTITV